MSFKSYAEGIKMLDNFIIEEEKKEGYAYYIITNELIYELKQRRNGGGE